MKISHWNCIGKFEIFLISWLINFISASVYDAKYHTNEELQKTLENLATTYPHKAFLYSIGKSINGKSLITVFIL